eukprot:530355-Prorocentrum_lima.AAC.1
MMQPYEIQHPTPVPLPANLARVPSSALPPPAQHHPSSGAATTRNSSARTGPLPPPPRQIYGRVHCRKQECIVPH